MSFTSRPHTFHCMNSLCPCCLSNTLIQQVVLVFYLVSLFWTDALIFYLLVVLAANDSLISSPGDFFSANGTAFIFQGRCLRSYTLFPRVILLPITDAGVQQSNLLYPRVGGGNKEGTVQFILHNTL